MIICDVANMIMDTRIVTKVMIFIVPSIRQGTHLADFLWPEALYDCCGLQ